MRGSDRRKRETEDLRRRVLDAAEEIIVGEGAQYLTMRRLAESIEYAPTVLYRLFANKDDLVDHLIARGYEGVRELYGEVLARESADPFEVLKRILEVYAGYALDHQNHYRMWFATGEIDSSDGELTMRHGRLEYRVFRVWLDAIEACREAGFFPDRNSEETFQLLWSRMHGLISLRIQHPDFPWMPLEDHLADVLDQMGGGA